MKKKYFFLKLFNKEFLEIKNGNLYLANFSNLILFANIIYNKNIKFL